MLNAEMVARDEATMVDTAVGDPTKARRSRAEDGSAEAILKVVSENLKALQAG